MKFSAVILAGGRSQRMGCDKAWLLFEGKSLLARQIELVRQVEPEEIFISGRAGRITALWIVLHWRTILATRDLWPASNAHWR
jgi:molybdopterin-guanine dinucleotide biosynthesis protein A